MDRFFGLNRNIIGHRILLHVLFWMGYFFLDVLKLALYKDIDLEGSIIFNISALSVQIAFTYLVAYLIIPLYFEKKQKIIALILLIIGLYLFAVLNRVMIVHVAEELTADGPFPQETIFEIFTQLDMLLIRYMPSNLGVAMVFLAIKFLMERQRNAKAKLTLEKEKSASDLKILKAQLNPHFLFNTLNNIYSLSISNSPETSDSISKLSNILDHILYRTESNLVPLSNELSLIRNYIELEQLRYDERLKVNMNVYMNNEFDIPPLLLLSLVENAFKHGAGEDSGSPIIDIDAKSDKDEFEFSISNTVKKNATKEINESIGLSNIRKQLDVLFGSRYTMDVAFEKERFNVVLKLKKIRYDQGKVHDS